MDEEFNAYEIEIERAFQYLISRLAIGELLVDIIGKIRGSYSQAVANSVQGKISKILIGAKNE